MHEKLYAYFLEKYPVSRDEFRNISQFFQVRQFKRNEVILSMGEICQSNYFVNAGCLRFYSLTRDGTELTRYFAFPGKFGTALSSLIDQKPSFEFIQCIEDSEVLEITRENFFDLVAASPAVNSIYRDILEMAYITSQERIYGLQGDSALERLKWLMAYHPKILSKLSNKVIASYLGVTPYTLSRLKTEL